METFAIPDENMENETNQNSSALLCINQKWKATNGLSYRYTPKEMLYISRAVRRSKLVEGPSLMDLKNIGGAR